MSLHDAAAAGDLKTIKAALLEPSTDPNAAEAKTLDRPLHLAARHGQLEAIRLLLEDPGATQRIRLNELNAVSA